MFGLNGSTKYVVVLLLLLILFVCAGGITYFRYENERLDAEKKLQTITELQNDIRAMTLGSAHAVHGVKRRQDLQLNNDELMKELQKQELKNHELLLENARKAECIRQQTLENQELIKRQLQEMQASMGKMK